MYSCHAPMFTESSNFNICLIERPVATRQATGNSSAGSLTKERSRFESMFSACSRFFEILRRSSVDDQLRGGNRRSEMIFGPQTQNLSEDGSLQNTFVSSFTAMKGIPFNKRKQLFFIVCCFSYFPGILSSRISGSRRIQHRSSGHNLP